MSRETVLVTGASSGIGLELARLFAAEGSDLVLVARSRDRLRELAGELESAHGVSVRDLAADLAERGAPERVYGTLQADGVAVDVLVNNAGYGAGGTVAELDLERQLGMIRLNVEALTALTRLCLPGMLERRRGGVLNVGSTAAFQAGPRMAVYYATKAYVQSFTEALAEELRAAGPRAAGVTATCLAPGPTATGFQEEADIGDTLLAKLGFMDARQVAEAGLRGFRRGKVLVVPGLKNKLGVFSTRLMPRSVLRRMVHKIQS